MKEIRGPLRTLRGRFKTVQTNAITFLLTHDPGSALKRTAAPGSEANMFWYGPQAERDIVDRSSTS